MELSADWVIDMEPEGGGEIIHEATSEEVAWSEGSYTGQHLKTAL